MSHQTVNLLHYDTLTLHITPDNATPPTSSPCLSSPRSSDTKMAPAIIEPDESVEHLVELSPIDQIQPRGYIRIILCFSLQARSNISTVSQGLEHALNATISRWPIFGGTVALARDGGECHGRLEVRYSVPPRKAELLVKDLGFDEFPYTYEELDTAGMPLFPLDELLLCSVPPVPQSTTPVPVVLAQANFISGGLLMSICLHHAIADGRGAFLFISALAAEVSRAPVVAMDSSTKRRGLFQASPAGPPATHLAYRSVSAAKTTLSNGPADDTITNRLFTFPVARLKELKETITANLPDPTNEWVSTNDCLAAVLWSTITRARLPNLNVSDSSSFALAVDVRSRASPPISPTYAGAAVVHSIATSDVSMLTSTTASSPPQLAKLALSIRKSLQAVDNEYISQTISLGDGFPDIRDFGFKISPVHGSDLMLTSWRDFSYYSLDFGELGKPQWLRKPWTRHAAVIVVLPWDRCAGSERGLEVILMLPREVMDRLEQDTEFMEWVRKVVD